MNRLPHGKAMLAALICVSHCVVPGWAGPPAKDSGSASTVTLRQALDQRGDVVFEGKSLVELAAYFKSKLKVEVRYDNNSLMQMGIDPNTPLFAVKLRDAKIREGLKAALSPMSLTYGLVGNTIFLGPEEQVIHAQMRQRVSVDAEPTTLGTLLKSLGEQTGANLLIDPRIEEKTAKATVKLKLDDVALETAVRLLAEVSGFATVRMGNVLMVTTEERAEKLRAVTDGPTPVTLPMQNLPVVTPPAIEIAPAPGGFGGPGAPLPAVQPQKKD